MDTLTNNTNPIDLFLLRVSDNSRLRTVLGRAKSMGVSLVLKSEDQEIKTYSIANSAEELNFCTCCKRILIDTTYCDGCEEDAENSFNQSDY